jgi:secreted trypsin-like serine protease
MTERLLGLLATVAALLAVGVGPAGAITGGQVDGGAHPYVGLMVAYDGDGNIMWLCSGTLMSPKVFVTAGHCTDGVTTASVYFEPGPVHQADVHFDGTPVTPDDFAFPSHDLGVVLLAGTGDPMGIYGVLPQENQLDLLKTQRGHQDGTFTTVGYGMEKSFPPAASWKDVSLLTRMNAAPHLTQIDGGQAGDFGMVLSNNARTGGACFGDSGGPNFVGDSNVVAGITSALANSTCAGTTLVFRLDRSWALAWLATFGLAPS